MLLMHPYRRSARVMRRGNTYVAEYLSHVKWLPFLKYWKPIPKDFGPIIHHALHTFNYVYGKEAHEAKDTDPDFARSLVSAYWKLTMSSEPARVRRYFIRHWR